MSSTMAMPRPEYPRPQFVRQEWLNLNGEWQFEIDAGVSGKEREWFKPDHRLGGTITVPFCPESKLSGVGVTDFMPAVWYRRTFELPAEWRDGRTLLHFGAVDYETEVWINGRSAGTHRGGYASFRFDITDLLVPGVNVVTVYAQDDVRSGRQPRGKQSARFHSHGCDYTRTTGIWQTVWAERVPGQHIAGTKYVPDPDNAVLHIEASLAGDCRGCRLKAAASYEGRPAGSAAVTAASDTVKLTVPLTEAQLWEPGNPRLYDLALTLERDGETVDRAESYFGLRSVKLDGMRVLINGKSVFQRLVLDQGFYPDGIYTAPTDDDLAGDIRISLGLGFNGARLHEKMFEPRFLYWADRLGYLVWGEHANWGLDITTAEGLKHFLPEWLEGVERDFNHPSIIGWCPFNETWDKDGTKQDNEVLRIIRRMTKLYDPTRPVIDTSGNYHVETDIFDVHDYDQNPETFRQRYESLKTGGDVYVSFPDRQAYGGQPYFVSEYGGIWWNPEQKDGKAWGYGERPKSEEEFIARYEGLTSALLDHPQMFGFCYTQLYDIEQEVNGLYTYDRKPKFDPGIFRRINSRKAAIED